MLVFRDSTHDQASSQPHEFLASLQLHEFQEKLTAAGAFRDAFEEAAALHAHDELFAKHIEPEPAPEDPVEWAMASDDEDDAPMPDTA